MSFIARVCFVSLALPHYRVRFHQLVRDALAERGVDYRLIYSSARGDAAKKGDSADIDWAEKVSAYRLSLFGHEAFWQSVFQTCKDDDLVIIGQENKLLVNYFLQIRYLLGGAKVAFWGHGKDFQSRAPRGFRARWKRFWLSKVHWWFSYTRETGDSVAGAGFPRDRITVFNNAIDSGGITRDIADLPDTEIDIVRGDLGIQSDNIGIYIGGMYRGKRLEFLIEAARLIRVEIPDFHLLLIGDGGEAPLVERAAKRCDFIHFLGPKFGREKALLAMMSKVLLMPGVVGLVVLDSFAYGLPMVTTALPYHGPEFTYLKNGFNGIVVREPQDVVCYARAVIELLQDEELRQRLRTGALESSADYSIEAMAERFVAGVLLALGR